MLLYLASLSSHGSSVFPSAPNNSSGKSVGQTRSLIVKEDSWWHLYPIGLYVLLFFPFHLALTAAPSSVPLSSFSTVIFFLSLDVCLYAFCYRNLKGVCVFLSVREPAVTVHLTGFFHTPKLLQPQLQNPENCKQAIHGLGFHTSLDSLLYHIMIALTGFCC